MLFRSPDWCMEILATDEDCRIREFAKSKIGGDSLADRGEQAQEAVKEFIEKMQDPPNHIVER